MAGFLTHLCIISVCMTLFSFLIMILSPFAEKKYSSKVNYHIWMMIIICMLIPFPLWPELTVFQIESSKMEQSIQKLVPENMNIVQTSLPTEKNGMVDKTGRSLENVKTGSGWTKEYTVLLIFILWLAGSMLYLCIQCLKHIIYQKMVMRWSEKIENHRINEWADTIAREMGISKTIPIYQSGIVSGPMLSGLFHPGIFLPDREYEGYQLNFILRHELIHYKRKDLWCKLLILCAKAIHWFNPFVLMIARQAEQMCEVSCDEEVLIHADLNQCYLYTETIIEVMRNGVKNSTILSTTFWSGKKIAKRRILFIMNNNKKKAGKILVILAAAAAVAIGSAVTVKRGEDSVKEGKDQQIVKAESSQDMEGLIPWSQIADTVTTAQTSMELTSGMKLDTFHVFTEPIEGESTIYVEIVESKGGTGTEYIYESFNPADFNLQKYAWDHGIKYLKLDIPSEEQSDEVMTKYFEENGLSMHDQVLVEFSTGDHFIYSPESKLSSSF